MQIRNHGFLYDKIEDPNMDNLKGEFAFGKLQQNCMNIDIETMIMLTIDQEDKGIISCQHGQGVLHLVPREVT